MRKFLNEILTIDNGVENECSLKVKLEIVGELAKRVH
jgi:hypothetical protein